MQTINSTQSSTVLSPTKVAPPMPWLPPELVSQILIELWSAPQSPLERTALFKNICGVNRTWLSLFARVAMRHVHIPTPLSADGFLRLLPERTLLQGMGDVFTEEASQLADKTCRSITFHVDGSASPRNVSSGPPVIKLYSDTDVAQNAVSTVLYMVTVLEHLPNLRHIALQYTDWGYDDIFDQLRVPVFPTQVTHLTVDFTFSAPALLPLAAYLKSLYTRHPQPRMTIPTLRHLSVSGVPTEFIMDIIRVCPNVETLEITNASRLCVLVPLPASVRMLVLRHPAVALGREEMHRWTLDTALEGGLLASGTDSRIVIRSGTPDPIAFMDLRRRCKRHGAKLTYERDDCTFSC